VKTDKGGLGLFKEAGERARRGPKMTPGMTEKQMMHFHRKMALLRLRQQAAGVASELEGELSVKRIEVKETNLKSLERIYSAKPVQKKHEGNCRPPLSSEDGEVTRYGKRPQTGVEMQQRLTHKNSMDKKSLAQELNSSSGKLPVYQKQIENLCRTSTDQPTRQMPPSNEDSDSKPPKPAQYLQNTPIVFNPMVLSS
jgi:hypothetical protein